MGELVSLGSAELGDAYLAIPASGSGPGVVVSHSWWGRTHAVTELCERLADDGFVAIAPDFFDGIVASNVEDAERLVRALPRETPQRRLHAALDLLNAHEATASSRLGVIGCSFGAAHAILLSAMRPDEVRAVVMFYGTTEHDLGSSRADYLGHFVEDDEYEPQELVSGLRQKIEDAGRVAEFYAYPGARHWFFEANRPEAFDAEAAELAYRRTVEFLKQRLV